MTAQNSWCFSLPSRVVSYIDPPKTALQSPEVTAVLLTDKLLRAGRCRIPPVNQLACLPEKATNLPKSKYGFFLFGSM